MISKIRRRKDHLTIFIEGAIQIHNAQKFYNHIKELELPESKILILNLKGCSHLDSAGVGVLIQVFRLMQERNSRLHIALMPPKLRKIMEETRLIDYLPFLSEQEYHLFEESESLP